MKLLIQLVLLILLVCFAPLTLADDELSDEILSAGEEIEFDWRFFPAEMPGAVFPVKGSGPIISVFGDPRPNGRRHEGVDIGAPRNRNILAAWPGVVVYSGWDSLGGWAVKIRHSNGLATYYAHLNKKSALRRGAVIKQGEYIGPVGNSGAAHTVTHLHFGIYNGRRALNPLKYIPRKIFEDEDEI